MTDNEMTACAQLIRLRDLREKRAETMKALGHIDFDINLIESALLDETIPKLNPAQQAAAHQRILIYRET
jgi:hypothetical protein